MWPERERKIEGARLKLPREEEERREEGSMGVAGLVLPGLHYATLTCLLNIAISSLNDSDEHTSPPCTPGSLGVHVANSHFSKISAKSGNSGCLQKRKREKDIISKMNIKLK